MFQLTNIQNITKQYWGLKSSTIISFPKFGTILWISSKQSWQRQLVSMLFLFFPVKSRIWVYGGLLTLCFLIVTHPPHVVCCYIIYSITDVKLLITDWFFARFGFKYRYKSKVFSIVINGIPDCLYCFHSFSLRQTFWHFSNCPKSITFNSWKHGSK